jgi:hypothetical protein
MFNAPDRKTADLSGLPIAWNGSTRKLEGALE